MTTPTNRPNDDPPPHRSRTRRRVSIGLEPVESRLLLATGVALDHRSESRLSIQVQAIDRDDAISTPADVPRASTQSVNYSDSLTPGDASRQYSISIGEADSLQLGITSRSKTPDFVANVAIYTGDGTLLTSGPLASSSAARGTNLLTIVGIPRGDLGSQPGFVRIDIPATGPIDPNNPYQFELDFNFRSNPADPHSAEGATSIQPTPSPDGTGGWFLDMTPQTSPSVDPSSDPSGSGGMTNGPAVPQVSGPLPSTIPTPPATDPNDPGYGIPLGTLDDKDGSPPPADSITTGPPRLVAPPRDEPHRPPPVDLVTPAFLASRVNHEVLVLADGEATPDGSLSVSWNGPIDRPSIGFPSLASPIDWTEGNGDLELSPTPRVGALGLDSRDSHGRTILEMAEVQTGPADESPSQDPGRSPGGPPTEMPPSVSRREDSEGEAEERLMPVLAGLGGSSALFAGLLLPDLSERLSRLLGSRLVPNRRRGSNSGRRERPV